MFPATKPFRLGSSDPVDPPDGPLAPVTSTALFELISPDGSLIGRSVNIGDVTTTGEVDAFLFALDAGQTVTVVAEPGLGLQPHIELFAPE